LVNASTKTIVAYEVSIEATPDYGGGFEHVQQVDHYFDPQLQFVPGAQESLTFSGPGWSTGPRGNAAPAVPRASFTVLFVEFSDGSKFGTSHWAAKLSDGRQRAVERMQEMAAAYQDSGEDGLRGSLTAALGRQDNPFATLALMNRLKWILDSEGPDGLAKEVNEYLAAGHAHREIM
jgi:hypothetical protein